MDFPRLKDYGSELASFVARRLWPAAAMVAIVGLIVFPRFAVSSPSDSLPLRDQFDTVRIAVRDESGREWPLVSSLAETFHGAGGTELSHDGRRLAFSARIFPVLDAAHSKSEAPNGLLSAYADGTPAFRRGNRL